MKRIFIAIIALVAMVAFNSCDKEKTTAQKLVKEFLKENLVSEDFKVMDYSRLDSTKLISDSVFLQLRADGAKSKLFKADIHYADGPKTRKLNYLRVKYRMDKDTVNQTFYLDDQLTRIVAFKTD